MPRFEPCPSCERHIRTDEVQCPFCAANIAADMRTLPERVLPRTRLGRAALFAFGVGAAATVVTGCKDDDEDDEQMGEFDGGLARDSGDEDTPDAGDPDAGDITRDASDDGGSAQPLYGLAPGPEDDAGVVPIYGSPALPPITDKG